MFSHSARRLFRKCVRPSNLAPGVGAYCLVDGVREEVQAEEQERHRGARKHRHPPGFPKVSLGIEEEAA